MNTITLVMVFITNVMNSITLVNMNTISKLALHHY